jgi:hypothetical protein
MDPIESFGTGGVCDRELGIVELPNLESLPANLNITGPHFACLVLCDSHEYDANAIGSFAESLLVQGAVYVCAWGPDCERVHDIFDEEIVGGGPEVPRFSDGVMTTWHDNEDLDDALFFFLLCTYPDDEFSETCCSALVISVGNSDWADLARAALSKPSEFLRRVSNDGKSA